MDSSYYGYNKFTNKETYSGNHRSILHATHYNENFVINL